MIKTTEHARDFKQARDLRIASTIQRKMEGSPQTTWEASYDYVDPGVKCSDELDGNLPQSQIYASSTVDIEATGVYHVTYEAINSQGTWNYGFNYDTCAYVRTVTIVDTLKPIIELKYGSAVSCTAPRRSTSRPPAARPTRRTPS